MRIYYLLLGLLISILWPNSILASVGTVDTTADYTIQGEGAQDRLGISLEPAGDVNGDGHTDLIIGAYDPSDGPGRAYLYFGGPNFDTTADLTLTGESNGDTFGQDVAAAGDVNNDGYDDVIIGALRNDAALNDSGRAYIYFGGKTMDATADVTFTGGNGDNLGVGIASIGDINGDGYDDVLVGADTTDVGAMANAGKVYLFYGGSPMDTTADFTFEGEAANDQFGVIALAVGDTNHDGYADFIIGAHLNDTGANEGGRVYLYYGGPSVDTTADVIFTGTSATERIGTFDTVASVDLNNDGNLDLIIGGPNNDIVATNAGQVYIYYGSSSTIDNTADVTLPGTIVGGSFGQGIAPAGDVNKDGYQDIIIGASSSNSVTENGSTYVYFGGTSFDTTPDLTFVEEGMTGGTADRFGIDSLAFDVNLDGLIDIIIGASGNDEAAVNAGKVYFFLGSSLPDPEIEGPGPGNENDEPTAFPPPRILPAVYEAGRTRIRVNTQRDDAERVYLISAGKTFTLWDDGKHGDGKKGDLVYASAFLPLPANRSYTIQAQYFSITTKATGRTRKANSADDLIPHINALFRSVFGRTPSFAEHAYWLERVKRGDKTSSAALLGAMQWQSIRAANGE